MQVTVTGTLAMTRMKLSVNGSALFTTLYFTTDPVALGLSLFSFPFDSLTSSSFLMIFASNAVSCEALSTGNFHTGKEKKSQLLWAKGEKSLDTICLSSVSSKDENASQIDDEASMQGEEVTKSQSATHKKYTPRTQYSGTGYTNIFSAKYKWEKQVHLMFQ